MPESFGHIQVGMMDFRIEKLQYPQSFDDCFLIRKTVFIEEQQVPLAEELDGLDDKADHYLLYADNKPAAVARLRYSQLIAKIERVAVLPSYRGKGIGQFLMKKIISDLQNHSNIQTAKLSSQVHAISFYENLGFQICSETYLDAGILHQDMMLDVG